MNWQQILLSFDKSFYYLFPATAVAMTTPFYVVKTYQSVFDRRMRTLQFRSPGIAPGNADESAPGRVSVVDGPLSYTSVRFKRLRRKMFRCCKWHNEVQCQSVLPSWENMFLEDKYKAIGRWENRLIETVNVGIDMTIDWYIYGNRSPTWSQMCWIWSFAKANQM